MSPLTTGHAGIRMSRAIPAPPDRVYRAWLEPDLLRRWMAPGVEVTRVEVDERVGGHLACSVPASRWHPPAARHSVAAVTEVGDPRAAAGPADPSTGPSPLRRAIERHLASRDVARVIYGGIIGLALVVALEQHPPTASQATGALLATAVAVGLAEVYSEFIGTEARTRRPVDRAELRSLTAGATAVAFGAGFPAVFFILAAAGAIDLDLAFTLAKWSGLGLICMYGFVAARLAGSGRGRALLHMGALGAIAGALIALKAVLH